MDCSVVVEAAVPVYDVETADEAVRIAISKTGEMLNPDLNYVEINMGKRACPDCGAEHDPAFIAADEGLVALELEMTVFNVEREEHAARIARKEIGQRLENIPLEVLEVEVIEEDVDEETTEEADVESDEDASTETIAEEPSEAGETAEAVSTTAAADEPVEAEEAPEVGRDRGDEPDADEEEEEEVLPEFEDLIDEQ